ncbi:MAG: sugar transferase [Halanaerobiales bacterium]|nr:sugar transferase [Halanaerobiales bacterium]
MVLFFYCQERVSKNDEIFKVLKFRTMVNKAEKESGPTLAEENDTRITRIGRFLRKTRNCHYYCPITCFCPGLSC